MFSRLEYYFSVRGLTINMATRKVFGVVVLFLCVEGLSKRKLTEPSEVSKDNFETKVKEKKCMFLYATRGDCEKCKLLYNKFLTVSQTFANEPDISFGYFTDRALADVFEVGSLPSIVYYEFGSAVPKTYRGDLTTAALTKVATKAMRIDLRYLTARYAVELTKANFDDIIRSEKQYRLVMLHEDDDEDEVEAFDEIAETYDNDMEVVLARINVDHEKFLDNKYISDVYPSFYWYPKGTVDKKKRYGGELRIEQMIVFINQQTGLYRMKGGKLSPFAGLIKPLDEVLNNHGKNMYELRNIGEISKDVKAAISNLPKETDKELTDYYLHLLTELDEDRTIETLSESRNRLYREMEGAGPLTVDQLVRKRNIVQKFIDIIGNHILHDLSEGELEIPQDMKDYITAAQGAEHGVEFHEEF